jgi:hypothetical protein
MWEAFGCLFIHWDLEGFGPPEAFQADPFAFVYFAIISTLIPDREIRQRRVGRIIAN